MTRKILLPVSLAFGISALAAGVASASCNVVIDSGPDATYSQQHKIICDDKRVDDDIYALAERPADDGPAAKDDGFRDGSILRKMVEADPPASASPSFLNRVFAFLFGGPENSALPGIAMKKTAPASTGLADGDLLCTVTAENDGDMRRFGMIVAANKAVSVEADAELTVRDGNSAFYATTQSIALAAGESAPIEIVTTNASRKADIRGSLKVGRRTIACL